MAFLSIDMTKMPQNHIHSPAAVVMYVATMNSLKVGPNTICRLGVNKITTKKKRNNESNRSYKALGHRLRSCTQRQHVCARTSV
jgi:hypothetical protein